MTVQGHDLVLNCQNCYYKNGYGMRLKKNGGSFDCPVCSTRYKVNGSGFIEQL